MHLLFSGTRCRAWHSKGSDYATDLDLGVESLPCGFFRDTLDAVELQVPPSEETPRCLDVFLTAAEPCPSELFLRSLSGCSEHVLVILPKAWLFLRELWKELPEHGCCVEVRWFGIHCSVPKGC